MKTRRLSLLPDNPEIGWTPWAWLIYLAPFVALPIYRRDAPQTAAVLGATAAFLVLYFAGYWSRGRRLALITAAITGIGCAFLPVNGGAPVFFIYAAAFAPLIDRQVRTTVLVVAPICGLLTAEALLLHIHPLEWGWGVVFSALVAALNVHQVKTSRMNAELRAARHEIEQLARIAERERIARDIHDVMGHTLSLIVLKSELAVKVVERDPARAIQEIRDVERVSRETLAQVRSAITGYRSAGLARELQSAEEAFSAAGIELRIVRGDTAFTPAEEAVLSLALRESVTNVIRHGGARHCAIVVERGAGVRRLIVEDDGRGVHGPEGMGLRRMRERLESIGGAVRVTSSGGTRVSIELPDAAAAAAAAAAAECAS